MNEQRLSTRPLVEATLVGTVLQVAMVVAGHYNAGVATLFAPMGMTISLLAGLMYALRARPGSKANGALGGAVAGGVCAFLGILVSFLLGDVPAAVLGFGTLSSVVTGAIGGLVGQVIGARSGPRPLPNS
jgi:hypothetical protein